ALDLLVLARVQRGEGQVLDLPLDRVDAEPMRDRRVDLQGLLGLVDLLLLGQRADRAHVVQAIGELDEDDPVVPVDFVTPATKVATSSPMRSRTSSSEALVSSTVSCSRAAHSVSVSRRMP